MTETQRLGFVAAKGGAKGSMFHHIFSWLKYMIYEIYKSLLCRYTDIYIYIFIYNLYMYIIHNNIFIYIYIFYTKYIYICKYIFIFRYVYMSMYCLGYGLRVI